jgi:hypothetical protein
MSLSRFKLNHGGIQSYLDGGHGVSSLLQSKAQAVLSAAQGGAPVDSGEYRASLHIEEDHTDRMVVRVVADVPYSHVIEADAGNLARALDAAG